jgi:DNA-binding PadR family transcriptional regulator
MTMAKTFKRSPLALAVLVLLYEAPMHPYRMQQLIKERGKDKVINVQKRASLYQTINQLQRAGLIAVRETARDENRPERTIYALTEKGLQTARDWLREMLSTPADEYPDFPAAISFLPVLTVEDALQQLERREAALAYRIADIDAGLQSYKEVLPRLFLLEEELMRATFDAELTWVRSIINDLRSGDLTWSEELRRGLSETNTDS